jgi:hypothetical protein
MEQIFIRAIREIRGSHNLLGFRSAINQQNSLREIRSPAFIRTWSRKGAQKSLVPVIPRGAWLNNTFELNMSIQRIQRIIIGAFGIIVAIPGLTMLLAPEGPNAPWGVCAIGLGFAVVVVAPSAAFVCGVRWCRFIVGTLAVILLLFWSLSPLMQHAIDRHAGFWISWIVIETVLIATSIVSFKRTSNPEEAKVEQTRN